MAESKRINGKLNVVFLSTRIYPDPHAGGPAKNAYFLSKYVQNRIFRMIIISSAPYPHLKNKTEIKSDSFELHYLPITGLKSGENSLIAVLKFFILFGIFSFIKILRVHRKYRIDLIHAQSPSITGIITLLVKFIFGIPFIYTYRGVDYKVKLEIYIYKYVNRFTNQILCVSRKIPRYFKKYRMDYSGKTKLIPNGIECLDEPFHVKTKYEFEKRIKELDLHKLGIKSHDSIILYVGMMIFRQKVLGMIDFMKGFDEFMDEYKNKNSYSLYLVFIGDGPYKNLLMEEYKLCRNKENIIFLGKKPFDDVLKFFSIASLSALTSYVEGFPTVILESMASGVPCLASDVGENKSIIRDSGFIVKAGDRIEIKKCLMKYFSDEELQRLMSKKAFEIVKNNYDWKIIAQNMRILYLRNIINYRI